MGTMSFATSFPSLLHNGDACLNSLLIWQAKIKISIKIMMSKKLSVHPHMIIEVCNLERKSNRMGRSSKVCSGEGLLANV